MKSPFAKICFVMLLAVTLPGCGYVRQQQAIQAAEDRQAELKAANDEVRTDSDECKAKFNSGELSTHVAEAKCINEKSLSVYQRVHAPNLDLLNIKCAARLVGAEKIDKKKATEGEVELQLAELSERLVNEARRRDLEAMQAHNQAVYADAAASQAHAANTAATGSFLQGLAALQPRAPSVKTTTCNGIGGSVNCTTVGP